MPADQHVLDRRHVREQADVLERAADAGSRDAVHAAGRRRARRGTDLAGGRLVEAGQDVEERRLPGAVRADDADDRLLLDVEADVVERDQPLEGLRHVADGENRRASGRQLLFEEVGLAELRRAAFRWQEAFRPEDHDRDERGAEDHQPVVGADVLELDRAET